MQDGGIGRQVVRQIVTRAPKGEVSDARGRPPALPQACLLMIMAAFTSVVSVRATLVSAPMLQPIDHHLGRARRAAAEFRVQSLFEPNTANRPRKPYKPLTGWAAAATGWAAVATVTARRVPASKERYREGCGCTKIKRRSRPALRRPRRRWEAEHRADLPSPAPLQCRWCRCRRSAGRSRLRCAR